MERIRGKGIIMSLPYQRETVRGLMTHYIIVVNGTECSAIVWEAAELHIGDEVEICGRIERRLIWTTERPETVTFLMAESIEKTDKKTDKPTEKGTRWHYLDMGEKRPEALEMLAYSE